MMTEDVKQMPEVPEELNPYVGPRTFEETDGRFYFGREREARELHSLVIAEPLVIFSGQSGAGKSSLLNTRLIPQLRGDGFHVLPPGRVGGTSGDSAAAVPNIFVHNLIQSLDQGQHPAAELASLTLSVYLRQYHPHQTGEEDSNRGTVLIVDQFEELATHHLERWADRQGFYQQLNDALLADDLLWVVLTMREDYAAAVLEPYRKLLTGRMQARFYLQRMELSAAMQAIERPAALAKRPFAEGVAHGLAENLLRITRQDGSHSKGQYIEPVQLQVVCYQLWEQLKGRPHAPITQEDVDELGDVDEALAHFYEQTITAVLQATHAATELTLRNWFDTRLITEAGTRGTVYMDETATATMSNDIVHLLANKYLLHAEIRAGGTWYELIHDRFIPPIQQANQVWRIAQSSLIQAAQDWDNSQRPPDKLYQDELLVEALSSVQMDTAEPVVKAFLEAGIAQQSQRELADVQADAAYQAERAQREANNAKRLRRLAFSLVIIGAVGFLIALIALLFMGQAARANAHAQVERDAAQSHQLAAETARADGEVQNQAAQTARAESVALQGTAVSLKETADAAKATAQSISVTAEGQSVIAQAAQATAVVQKAIADDNLEQARVQEEAASTALDTAESNRRLQVAQALAFHILDAVAAQDVEQALLLAQEAAFLSEDQEARENVQASVDLALRPLIAIPYSNHTLFAYEGAVLDFVLDDANNVLTTMGADGVVKVWDLNEQTPAPRILPVEKADFMRLAAGGTAVLVLNSDGNGAIWNPAAPDAPPQTVNLGEPVLSAAIAPDGSQIVFATENGRLKQWLAADDSINEQREFDSGNFSNVHFTETGDFVSADANRVAQQYIYERLADGRLRLHKNIPLGSAANNGDIPRDAGLFTGDAGSLWRVISEDGRVIFHYDNLPRELMYAFAGNNGGTASVDINSTGTVLANAAGGTVLLRRIDPYILTTDAVYPVDRPPFAVLAGHEGRVTKVRFMSDDKRLISAGTDGTVRIWSPQFHNLYYGGNKIDQLAVSSTSGTYQTNYGTGAVALAVSPDGTKLVTAQPNDTLLLWSPADPDAPPQVLPGSASTVHRIAFSPDGAWLAVADGRLRQAGKILLWNTDDLSADPIVLADHKLPVADMVFTPDGRYLISGGGEGRPSVSSDNTLRFWDMSDLQAAPNLTIPEYDEGISALAVSPDGQWLAVGFRNDEIFLYSLADIENIATVEPGKIVETSEQTTALAFDPQSKLLAAARANGVISLWDIADLSAPKTIYSSHAGEVTALAFSPDGTELASAGDDALLRIWTVGDLSGQPLLLAGHETAVSDLTFTSDGNYLISAGADTVRIWDTLQTILADPCEVVGRNLTQREWEQMLGTEAYRQTCTQYPPHYSTPETVNDDE